MKKFEEFLAETLADEVKSEPKTAAAKEARKLGLTYMGFGRYADNKGKIAYIVDNDRLVPYKSREEVDDMFYKHHTTYGVNKKSMSPADVMKKQSGQQEIELYNKTLNNREANDSKILKQKEKEASALNKELYKLYKPNMFSQEELQALQYYTADGYEFINKYLYKGHEPGTSQDEADQIDTYIDALDSAFEETQAPFAYSVYSGLSSRYSADKIEPGGEYIFRGYLSTSIDFDTAISSFASAGTRSDASVVLQIEVSKGQKSIYLDPLSANSGERETLLPRGSRIKVISGPHIMDYGIINPNADEMQVALFHCELMEDL